MNTGKDRRNPRAMIDSAMASVSDALVRDIINNTKPSTEKAHEGSELIAAAMVPA